ncbi:SIMPL domain-containing protein, partial [Candidatus Bathyarchaeota archaeon]|nr:SIMPL domain-containing protein [Candidatus Bathyarchaeota archaeon]
MLDEEMSLKRQYVYVVAICLSVIIAGAIIAYNPFQEKEDDNVFKFPSGIPPSLGMGYATSLGEGDVNSIQVSGQGSVSATATQATLTLGAWTEDPVAAEAVEDNALLMTSIIDAIMGLGIEEDKIKTVTYSVSTNYDWEARAVIGYR